MGWIDVVERPEHRRANALDVPQMEELVRHETDHKPSGGALSPRDAVTIEVLQPAARSVHIDEERIALIRRAAHQSVLFGDDLLVEGKEAVEVDAAVIVEEHERVGASREGEGARHV